MMDFINTRIFFYFAALLSSILVNVLLIINPAVLIPFLILEGVAISAILANEAADCLIPIKGRTAPARGMISFAAGCGLMACCTSSLVLAKLPLSSIALFMLPTLVIIGSVAIGTKYAASLAVSHQPHDNNADWQTSLSSKKHLEPAKNRCPITGRTAEDIKIKQCPKIGPITTEELQDCEKYLRHKRIPTAQRTEDKNTTETTITPVKNVQQNTGMLTEKPKTAITQTNLEQAQTTENQQVNAVAV